MCYRKNIGGGSCSKCLFVNQPGGERCSAILGLLLTGVLLMMALLGVSGCQRTGNTAAPWFGRGQNLPKAPITVLIGPIDLDKGISGCLELAMKRSQVEAVLGKPLVEEMPSDAALQQGIDPEHVMDNLYGGVFAWVLYTNTDEVASIRFEPEALQEQMDLKQRLLVRVGDQTLVLSPGAPRREVVGFLRDAPVKRVRDYGHYMVLEFEKSSCSIDFDREGHFQSLSIGLTD